MPGSGKPDSREVYADIIDLPAWEPGPDHPRMDLNQRAAQFLPFAALTGFDEAILETSLETEREIGLTDDGKGLLFFVNSEAVDSPDGRF
jgi:hypothetical protein